MFYPYNHSPYTSAEELRAMEAENKAEAARIYRNEASNCRKKAENQRLLAEKHKKTGKDAEVQACIKEAERLEKEADWWEDEAAHLDPPEIAFNRE